MSTHQVHDIDQYFPTEPWLEEYRVAIEDDEAIDENGAGWGVDFEGAMIFQIENIPLAERTIADLPEEILDALDERVQSMGEIKLSALLQEAPDEIRADVDARDGGLRERILAEIHETVLADAPDRVWDDLEAELPEILRKLLAQLEENVVDDDTVYAYLDLYDGGCREVDVIRSLDDRSYGFRIIGDYDQWKKLVSGEGGVINMLMSGGLDVDGDMQKILQYSAAAVDLADIAAGEEARFVV